MAGLGIAIMVVAAFHLAQGTSTVSFSDIWSLIFGDAPSHVANVVTASRLPRTTAAIAVGGALGASGLLLQSISRNKLASPDTLAVNAGAYLAVTAVAAFGITLPFNLGIGVAFLGALATAGLVLLLSAGGGASTTRLILAGSATALAATALTNVLLLLFQERTTGLFAWGSGNLNLTDFDALLDSTWVIGLSFAAAILMAGRFDVLRLGDDTASSLGIRVKRTRLIGVILALLLASCAVSIAGPVGFVGLAAPVIAAGIAQRLPGLSAHRVLLPLSALVGMLVLLSADVAMRGLLGAGVTVIIPIGVATTVVGAGIMVWVARRITDSPVGTPTTDVRTVGMRRAAYLTLLVALTAATVAAMFLGLLAGETIMLGGDILNWLQGQTGAAYTWILDQRWPRVLAALLAGAALAASGTATQAVCRNPLAEPGILGVTAGAGVGAVALITWWPQAGTWSIMGIATLCAVGTFALIYLLAWKGGLSTARLVLIGIAVSAIASALTVVIITYSDPWNTPKALTWLSGTTYGRTLARLVPVACALAVIVPFLFSYRRDIDLMALDEDTPRLVGLRLERTRLLVLGLAAVLAASAVVTVGVIGFVGLVAPHMARAFVGTRTAAVLPVAMLIGTILVSVSDTIGRWIIAPAQIPAGLVCAMVGTPYFIYLLWRSRA